jgi:hypothetical protein
MVEPQTCAIHELFNRLSVTQHVILSEAKNLGFLLRSAAAIREMFRLAQHDKTRHGIAAGTAASTVNG